MPSLPIYPTAEPFLPNRITLPALEKAARRCQGCDLYKCATQTVFGEGKPKARVMFVGEQPGDQEDRAGRPFVGPSGKLLDRILEQVGIDRSLVYVTNAVKHFKFEQRGKRRIHAKPSARQIAACKPWLKAEVQVIRPDVIVALGATAAQAMLGSTFKVTQHRGEVLRDTAWAPVVMATVHPSSLLRAPDEESRRRAIAAFESDLGAVKKQMDQLKNRRQPAPQSARRAPAPAHPGAAAREAGKPKAPARPSHPTRSRSGSASRPGKASG